MNWSVRVSVFLFFMSMCGGWDLSNFGVSSSNYFVSSVAIYRTRAFLAIPRSVCNNDLNGPTLVETNWIEELFHSQNIIGVRNQVLEYQEWGECGHIQDAVSLDLEHKKHKLWILDKGNEFCQPKIVSYSLFYNSIFETSELTNIIGKKLNIITIDSEDRKTLHRAYVGNAGENSLLVFCLEKLLWWKVELSEMNNPLSLVNADFLAISKNGPELYISSENDLELFVMDLEYLNISKESSMLDTEINSLRANVSLIGKKLGKSRGLEADLKSGLSYFMIRDYAIVRWLIGRQDREPTIHSLVCSCHFVNRDKTNLPTMFEHNKDHRFLYTSPERKKISSPIEAEYHNVLAQSYEEFPYVSELFTGPKNGLWAIVNPAGPEDCLKSNKTEENIPVLQSRVVRILRYNKFVKDLELDMK